VLLSAGLDSGLIAALASRQGVGRMRAVTAAFEAHAGTRADEAPQAAETAQALGLELVVRRLANDELETLVPRALEAMDQPSIDGVNTWLACLAAREAGLKVVLSGLGGDELFGSYPSFRQVPRLAAWAARGQRLPFLERPLGTLGRAAGRPKLAGLLAHGPALAGAYFLRRGLFLPDELAGLLDPDLAVQGLAAYDPLRDAARFVVEDAWLAVHRMESGLYLRNQLLRDADWASMAHSVELRTPLVDAWLNAALGAQRFEPARRRGKAFLVSKLAPELPASVLGRRKRGFAIPTGRPRARAGLNARALALEILERRGLTVRRDTISA
jgi:asparagine synthase (glutamine-hydrolysing)